MSKFRTSLALHLEPRMLGILLLGFMSGLPLALTASTLSTWLKDAGVNISTIGLFASVGIPYSIKFLWAPVIDSSPLPLLTRCFGRRRSWVLLTQACLVLAIAAMAFADPGADAWLTALAAFAVAAFSASQDVVLDAYRVERLEPSEYGPGTAMFTLGYRLGMLVSGAGALYLAEYYGWKETYLIMACVMAGGIFITLMMREPSAPPQERDANASHIKISAWFKNSVIAPFKNFMTHDKWLLILLFIALYKLGDAFLGNMTNPFLRELGFTKPQIATIVKVYGFAATILGTFFGGWLVQRYGALRPLFICGLLHALTNLMFLAQARVGGACMIPALNAGNLIPLVLQPMGTDSQVLILGISLENFTGGMSSAALVVFISLLCRVQFTATQFALLSSLASLGRTVLSTSAGGFVAWLGWEGFFIFAVTLALPSLILLRWLPRGRGQAL